MLCFLLYIFSSVRNYSHTRILASLLSLPISEVLLWCFFFIFCFFVFFLFFPAEASLANITFIGVRVFSSLVYVHWFLFSTPIFNSVIQIFASLFTWKLANEPVQIYPRTKRFHLYFPHFFIFYIVSQLLNVSCSSLRFFHVFQLFPHLWLPFSFVAVNPLTFFNYLSRLTRFLL